MVLWQFTRPLIVGIITCAVATCAFIQVVTDTAQTGARAATGPRILAKILRHHTQPSARAMLVSTRSGFSSASLPVASLPVRAMAVTSWPQPVTMAAKFMAMIALIAPKDWPPDAGLHCAGQLWCHCGRLACRPRPGGLI
jgi:hypothetical protein